MSTRILDRDVLNKHLKVKLTYKPLSFISFPPGEILLENELLLDSFQARVYVGLVTFKTKFLCREWAV